MTRRLSLVGAALLLSATLLATTACAGAESTPDAVKTPEPVATSPDPEPSPTESRAPVGDPTCETIIPAATVESFDSVGWTARAEPFRIGELEVDGGVQCIWGDFTTATDHVQIYGWAPISADQAVDAQDALVAQGWKVEEAAEGTFVTESADTTVATDDQGYGRTYLFGDGWVKYADTKQGLLLVTWG